ncbi:hypothetical protein AJ79_05247 [Helicocarpus griseus UAMH5409]|uniref:C3H1-type domain-containing protein n=1 Tax=Helicocarpus griseus UAMH5409 TaxID=1447875 RepID=A0A2B7XGC1_9EURO|nr:hypothetical protein AJ79_05247 [Helicocarpus griseus UAMH5409]
MSSSGFSFPPPPPPPPQSSFPGPAPSPAPYGQNQRGRGHGGYQRGRGRGNAHRGGRGGYSSGPSHGPPSNMNFAPGGGSRYGAHPYCPVNPSPPQYNPQGPVQYGPPQGQPNYSGVPPYTQPASHIPPAQTAYSQPVPPPYPPHHPTPPPAGYSSPASVTRHSQSPVHHSQPQLVAPPIRWGYENATQGGFYPPQDSRTPSFSYPDMRDSKPHQPIHQPHNRHGPRGSLDYNSFNSGNQFNRGDKFSNRGNKRLHSSAFGGSQTSNARPSASLPVPSFGNPLPSKPPPSVDATKKHKKKKRKYNQLGLTPKAEEHESSEEEDDVDEEAKLSQTVNSGELKFTYKGQTSTLQSSSDIAAWIEERKKKYPTRARVEERLKEAEEKKQAIKEAREAKKAKEIAVRQQKNAEQEEARRQLREARVKKEQDKLERKALREQETLDPADAAVKAKLRAEKLRRRLMKEEKRVAKAEADAEKARLRAESQRPPTNGIQERGGKADTASGLSAEHAPASQSAEPETTKTGDTQVDNQTDTEKPQPESSTVNPENSTFADQAPNATTNPAATDLPTKFPEASGTVEQSSHVNGITPLSDVTGKSLSPNMEASDSLSLSPSEDDLDLDDETSSSGSDSSSEDSDSSSSSEPEQATSRREHPDRVLPPARQSKNLCHRFVKTGQCRRGKKCKYLHEMPDKAKAAVKQAAAGQDKKGRKSLFQALMSREKEEEHRRVMQAISWLGQRGILDEPVTDAAQEVNGAPPVAQAP